MREVTSCIVVALAVLASCGSNAPTLAPAPNPAPVPASPLEDVRASTDTAPEPVTPRVVLGDTPTHRQLAWVLDMLGRHQGVLNAADIDQHWAPTAAHGPIAARSILETFRQWGAGATSASVERIEVDDPTYLRAHVAVGDHRWRVVLSIDPSSMKIDFLQWDHETTTARPSAR
jgi:hypothetical protein